MDAEEETLQMHLLHGYTTNFAKSHTMYQLLLTYLQTKNIRQFKWLVDQHLKRQPPDININYAYPNRSNETFLDIACKNSLPEFVEFLLEKGANVNRVNEDHNRAPIHFATEKGDTKVLSILLNSDMINPNIEAGQQTALHMAVKKNYIDCARLLLEKGASPYIPNNKGLTALHMAAMKSNREMVTLILEVSCRFNWYMDLDTYKDSDGQTTRMVLEKKLPDIQLPPSEKRGVNVHDLKYYLNANDETNFLKYLKLVEDDTDSAKDLIEMAVRKNFEDSVVTLLEKVRVSECSLEKAAGLAVQQASPNILREILNTGIRVKNDLLLDACKELGIPGKQRLLRLECFKLILEKEEVDVRCVDSKGNTPLHYAARADCREAVTLLLEKGSYIGHMNNFGIPPVADISVSTLSQYFDDCIQARKEGTNEYTIEFDYKCLMSHDNSHYTDNEEVKREMDIFRFIAENNSLKYLLKHPLLSSFLYLKWHRIRYILYLNFILYVLFYLLLNAYILQIRYHDKSTKTNLTSSSLNNNAETTQFSSVLRILAGIATLLLAIREIVQLISSPCHYVSSLENWMEMILVILGIVLVLNGANTQIAAITILLSAWALMILIGKHPRMSTGIEMFKRVSFSFMRFLFLYAFLILAFALAFFTLFKDGGDDNFPDPGHSLFKTIIMLTGEFDANDIPFVTHPILSHLVFVLFVFLIAIVLFNLLNGLAVNDTAEILGKAELVGLISRVQVLAYIENVAVRTPFIRGRYCFSLPYTWKYNPCATFFIRKILLFPSYLKNGKLRVKNSEPYGNRLYYKERSNGNSEGKVFSTFKMDPHIIKQAKDILSKRGQKSESEKIFSKLEELEIVLNFVKQKIEMSH